MFRQSLSRRLAFVVARATVGVVVVAASGACDAGGARDGAAATALGGDPRMGVSLIRDYGCGACHRIPGVREARGEVGPPLDHFGRRVYIAGNLANTTDNLVLWIVNPQGVEPGTAMPALGVNPTEAGHIAAYLHTLR